jgi:hypothetical protein
MAIGIQSHWHNKVLPQKWQKGYKTMNDKKKNPGDRPGYGREGKKLKPSKPILKLVNGQARKLTASDVADAMRKSAKTERNHVTKPTTKKKQPTKTPLPEFGNGLDVLTHKYRALVQIIEDLIIEGLTFFAGVAKLGKTTLFVQMSRPVCNPEGGEFLGRKVHPGKVLFISLEENKDSVQEKMLAQGWTKEEAANFTIMDFDEFRDNIGFLYNGSAVIELIKYIKAGEFTMVGVDSFKKAFMGWKGGIPISGRRNV